MNRRLFIRFLGVVAGFVLLPLRALAARPKAAFDSTTKDDALTELYGTSDTIESGNGSESRHPTSPRTAPSFPSP